MTFSLDALLILGSLRNDDDDGNENGKKAVGLDKQNNNVALDLLQVDLKSILASGASDEVARVSAHITSDEGLFGKSNVAFASCLFAHFSAVVALLQRETA